MLPIQILSGNILQLAGASLFFLFGLGFGTIGVMRIRNYEQYFRASKEVDYEELPKSHAFTWYLIHGFIVIFGYGISTGVIILFNPWLKRLILE
jgi:hypothetical protein